MFTLVTVACMNWEVDSEIWRSDQCEVRNTLFYGLEERYPPILYVYAGYCCLMNWEEDSETWLSDQCEVRYILFYGLEE